MSEVSQGEVSGTLEGEVELFVCNFVSNRCATCQKGKNFFKVEVKIGFILTLGKRKIQVNNNFKSIFRGKPGTTFSTN